MIESTFATVRHRTGKTKGRLNRKTGLAMAFKLMTSAQGKWRKLDGSNRMSEITQGIAFVPSRQIAAQSPAGQWTRQCCQRCSIKSQPIRPSGL